MRRVLITGVCGGVGRATAALFRADGWSTVGVDRRDPTDDLEIDDFVKLDMASEDVSHAIADIAARADRLDALVNNAALQIEKRLVDTDSASWDEVLATNVRGPFLATKGATEALRLARGSVVNVSSVHAVATSSGVAAYAASKGGLAAFTRAAALELAPEVRVNAVLPGAVDTPMLRAGIARWSPPEEVEMALQGLAERTPLGRVGDPAEIAQVILFLADGDRSSFITGQTIVADGGVTARLSSES
jgi:NAD(P)-dependent dehydrogenase (short-subunit alcohol dehydrogenase family)